MTPTDWIGFIGVTILLVAYFLNIKNILQKDSALYIWLNVIGAGIACCASVMLQYIPFIILEGCWTLVSIISLFNYYRKKI